MTIIQQPDALSLSYNIRDFRISSTAAVSFVLKKGTTELVAQTYEPGQDGYVTIKVRDIVHAQLSFTLQNISTVYEQPDIVADFMAVIDSTEVTFRVIRAGVDNFADSAANFLTANWLTWQPQEKPVTYSSPEYLTYYAVVAGTCKLKAYYTDESGTVTSEETITVSTLTAGKAYTMPMQYAVVSALLGSKLPASYDVWIENGSGNRLTYIQRYYAGNMKSEQEDWILFDNSLGGIDTFRAYGVTDFTGEHTHNIAEIDEVSEEYRVDTERKYQKNTGYLNERERRWLLDFFPSAHKMIYTSGALRTIVVTESDVTYKDKELPSSYTFTYKFADAKPLLNLTRASAPAEVLNIQIPDLGNFTVPPRLVELDSLPLTEGALFPVQSPYDESWKKTTAGALLQYIADKLTNNYQGGGGIGHTHNNLNLLQLLSFVDEYLLVDGDKIKAGYADEIPDEIDKIITFLKGWITENYTSGLLGTGAGLTIDPVTGKTRIEADELFIRMKAYFYELVIETLTHVGGQIILTPARMTCIKVEELTNAYRCYFKATDGEKTITNDFIVGDQATTREFNIKAGTTTGATNHYFWRLVTGIGDDYIDLSKTDCDTNSDAPLAGDDISQLGNRTDAGRMNAIILSSFGTDAPSFKQYAYIDSYSLVDKEVIVISKDGNRLVGDFILTTGINIATQLQILENLIKTEIQSVEYTINANDNYLSNASFTKDMENWQRDSDIEVFANDDPLVTNDEYYADADKIADVMTHDGKLWLRLKNSYVKQLNGDITQPAKAGTFYVSLRYVCTGTGTLTCGFSGQELYQIAPFALNPNPRMFEFSGDWDGTGDFLIQFTGDIYINLVALTNKPLDDFKTEVNTKFQQTSDSLTAIATSINNINRTISESGWLTTADGTEIWAACTFSDGTKAISLFEVTSEGVFMKGSKINLTGVVTFESFSSDFQTAYNQAFSNSQMISKNDIATQLGFANYADLVANAAQGKAVLVGGYLNLELIDVNTLLANKVISNKVVTALSGKRIEIDPDTNSIRLFDSANAEIGKITFTEEEYSSGINTYPRINLKRTNTENGVSTVNSEINVTPRYIEMSEYDTIDGTLSFNLNAITGLTFTKDNLPTKNYPAS